MQTDPKLEMAQPPVVVTQEDRDLAREIWMTCDGLFRSQAVADLIARHRLSTQSSMQARIEELEAALRAIQAIPGNVDHSTGHGPNAAEMRGGMLNDIRDIARATLSNIAGGQSNE